MKSSSARERVEEERVESRVGNGGIRTGRRWFEQTKGSEHQQAGYCEEMSDEGGWGGIVSTYKMQSYKDRMTRRLTTGDARDTCGNWQREEMQRRRRCTRRWCATSRTMSGQGSALWLTIEDRDDGWRRAKREFTHSRFARNIPTH